MTNIGEEKNLFIDEIESLISKFIPELCFKRDLGHALYDYYRMISTFNKHTNLIADPDIHTVIRRHIIDSLSLLKTQNIETGVCIADIGSGAGFPGLPLYIVRPDLNIVLVESITKKCSFLDDVIEKLGLESIVVINDRAENVARTDYRESFDIVTARAVSSVSTLAELCLPLTKVGGKTILYKSDNYETELIDAENAINTCGGGNTSAFPVMYI